MDYINPFKKHGKEIENELVQTEQELTEENHWLEVLEGFSDYNEEDRVISSEEAIKIIEEKRKQEGKLRYIKSGCGQLDTLIKGFLPGDVVVISGPTKNGKSLLMMSFTKDFCDAGEKCLWFSYEMSTEELIEKYNLDVPLFYLPRKLKESTLDWIGCRIIEGIAKFETNIVFIDHLHYLLDLMSVNKNINTSLYIGSIMRRLKNFAREYKVIIFLVSHITKTIITSPPTLYDLRDSSFTAQEADFVMFIWRPIIAGTNPPLMGEDAVLSLQANRRTGKNGNIELSYINGLLKEKVIANEQIAEQKLDEIDTKLSAIDFP